MRLKDWAILNGVTPKTAYLWFHDGKIPGAFQTEPGGAICVATEQLTPKQHKIEDLERTCIYARVSNHSRKKELDYQVQRCSDFAATKGYVINKIYKEVASGMNDNRQMLMQMLDSNPTRIIVENKDRLTRFGFNYLQSLLGKLNCDIIVINEDSNDEQDLMKDLVSIMTSFCCRLYGLRRGNTKAKKIKEIICQ